MALFGDDEFGEAKHARHFRRPFVMIFMRLGVTARVGPFWFARLDIIFLAVDEQHDVGVLLNRAGLAQIGKLGALIFARFNRTAKL